MYVFKILGGNIFTDMLKSVTENQNGDPSKNRV